MAKSIPRAGLRRNARSGSRKSTRLPFGRIRGINLCERINP